MRKLLFLLCCIPACVEAQTYAVANIPDSLQANARAIKRSESIRMTVKSASKAIIRHKYAITVMNEDGLRYSGYSGYYDKMIRINEIDGKLFDASGKEIKSVKKKDITDRSQDDDMSLITDGRIKQHRFYSTSFPYTVEYEDEIEMNGIFNLEDWMPIPAQKYALQQSSFTVEVPADYGLRFKQFNYAGAPVVTNSGKTITYQWELKNVPGFVSEPFQPDVSQVLPHVMTAPTKFEFGGYQGDMSTWQGLGKYISSLYVGRDALPENVKADIHRLTDGISDRKQKIRLIYEYMQQNTRYISIQLGIGGLQPFPATDVATKKYGDCKALSNYMVSLLKEVGIWANNVIITAGEGERGLLEDFPANYFNHAVMCVPDAKDTMWLECTSQTVSAGYMGGFTGNRKALFIADDGGHVVSTPAYKAKDNLQIRSIMGAINPDGHLAVDVATHFTGQQQERVHGLVHGATEKEREEFLNEAISLPTYKLEKFNYVETKGIIPAMDEYLKISAPNYAAVSGKRIFVMPNLFNRNGTKLPTDKPRRFDILLDYPYQDVDSINLAIPNGYESEAVPKDVSLKTKFGSYSISFKLNGNSIAVVRVSERNAGLFPATDYAALVSYYEEIYKADRSRFVLVKRDVTP
ncbi:DUF3857 domain-containing protein [Segetibacter sp. 3557_3]|uniref:DUF3857 domain-containing protein n=1 Tax=Segetibacter sp. 3557_3 TaxID=2547429 RepID=UPI0010583EEA|nr:DUF3857 domain-containing protein [Segetibacter sp. 3557_3]TDH27968.1 DUF3857 domain-containing protein [Segetibacter sp. 3557_3]